MMMFVIPIFSTRGGCRVCVCFFVVEVVDNTCLTARQTDYGEESFLFIRKPETGNPILLSFPTSIVPSSSIAQPNKEASYQIASR